MELFLLVGNARVFVVELMKWLLILLRAAKTTDKTKRTAKQANKQTNKLDSLRTCLDVPRPALQLHELELG